MKTQEKVPARGKGSVVGPSERASYAEIVVHKDVKNEGRSHDVYENKDTRDKIAETKSDIVSDNASILQNIEAFDGQLDRKLSCRVFWCGNQRLMTGPRPEGPGSHVYVAYARMPHKLDTPQIDANPQ